MHYDYVSLLLITLLAVVVPVLASRLRIVRLPIVVGEILAGMIIGKSGFNLVEPSTTLNFLAEFGFTFLMFLSGLEISLDALQTRSPSKEKGVRWKQPVPLALISFLLTITLAIGIGYGLTQAGLARSPILMGLILSTTSLGIVVPILKERGLTSSGYGQLLLVAALISDFLTLLLLSLVIAVLSQGIRLDLLLFLVLLVIFIAAAKLSQWMNRAPFLQRITEELSHATAQIRVRGAFALMVFWVVLAEALGVEVILGAFLAGAVLSISSRSEKVNLHDKLDAIGYGFFIPIFFINVGANFDLRALLASPTALVLLPALILSAYLVKLVPALLFRFLFPWRQTLAAGALLSSRLSLIIAASAIALELGMITDATNAAVILVAILSCTLSPLLFNRILPAKKTVPRRGIIILGTDQLAILLGQRLSQRGEPVTFIGMDQENLAYLNQSGFSSVQGDPTDPRVLEQAGIETARALVSVTKQVEALAAVSRLAIERYQVPLVVARADDPLLARELQMINVQVVQSSLAVAMALEVALEFPTAFSLLVDKAEGVEVRDIHLQNPTLIGQPLRHVRLPGNALVIGIQRQGEIIVPHGDTVLDLADKLLLLGSPDSLIDSASMLNGRAS